MLTLASSENQALATKLWGSIRLAPITINDLSTTGNTSEIWKIVDDTRPSEAFYKNIYLEVLSWSKENRYRLNPRKPKNLTSVKHVNNNMNEIVVNGQPFELVKCANILGMTIACTQYYLQTSQTFIFT